MSETVRCPDCGHPNPPGSTSCSACHFPLVEIAARGRAEGAAEEGGPAGAPVQIQRMHLARPRRPVPQSNAMLSLWLGVGAFFALLLVFIAMKANLDRGNVPIEGSSQGQQEQANALRAVLAKDSTDARAHVGLADILFDTGNWSEAIVHYRAAVGRDSSLVNAIVDMGVCYYNLSNPTEAERLFRLALAHDPHQPFALFNLGIVYEQRKEPAEALKYYHLSLESSPPENMKSALLEAMQRVASQSGKAAPPLK